MKFIQRIKDYFAPAYSVKYAEPTVDVRVLSAIGKDAVFLTASNKKDYFYYFPVKVKNIDVAKYLFIRNGIPVRMHKTMYNYTKESVLRVPMTAIPKNSPQRKFVDAIDTYPDLMSAEEIESTLSLLRRQMKGYER